MLPTGLPERTLGFQVLNWCSQYLVNPDSRGGVKGERWIFQPDQALFVLWFYAVDENGEWIYRRAYRERAKGTGKSPMVAAIACAEFLGPTEFSHFDDQGQAIGRRHEDALIWLAAVSFGGSKHTYEYIMGMLEGPAAEFYNLDVGLTRIIQNARPTNVIRQVSASPRSLEGPQPTFVICEETQHWIPSEHGPELMSAIARGLSKTDGRRIEVTNAPMPGQGSVAELTHEFWAEVRLGESDAEGLLFDTFSIHVDDIYDKAQAWPALEVMYQNAPWIKINRIWRDILDKSSHPETDSRRFFFNESIPPSSVWLKLDEWDGAGNGNIKLHRRDKISLGFRIRRDACALIATRLVDSAMFVLKVWEKSPHDDHLWEVPYGDVDKYVRRVLRDYNVRYFLASPNGFKDVIGRWENDFGSDELTFEAIWMDKNKVKHCEAVDAFEAAVRSRRLKHDNHPALRKHIMNCFTQEVPQGTMIRMKTLHSTDYIVAAEAAVLSFQGSLEAIADGALEEEADNRLFSFS